MIRIGLTGGIGMGKSTAAKILRGFGLPVHNADDAVHALLKKGGKGVKPVGKLFPEALKKDAIDRKLVGKAVFNNPTMLKKLEKILHPLVQDAEKKFISANRKKRAVVLEIPLLFETGAQKRCDVVICVSAPKDIQKQRVMARKGMTPARFKAILARQMPDDEKRRKADYVVDTGKGFADTKRHLLVVLNKIFLSK